jgi:hypothetical protein
MDSEQITLTLALDTLRSTTTDEPYDASLRAATATLRARISDVASLRDALEVVLNVTLDARMNDFTNADGPLAEYLRGVYAWTKGVARAMEELAHELLALAPDWARFRMRLEDAETFYFEPLESDIRARIERLHADSPGLDDARDPLHHLRAHIEEMFRTASGLRNALEQRFG